MSETMKKLAARLENVGTVPDLDTRFKDAWDSDEYKNHRDECVLAFVMFNKPGLASNILSAGKLELFLNLVAEAKVNYDNKTKAGKFGNTLATLGKEAEPV